MEQPLKLRTWVNYGEYSIFVMDFYEKLLVFCYRCERVRHGEASCPFASNHLITETLVSFGLVESEMAQTNTVI